MGTPIFEIGPPVQEEMSFKRFFFLFLALAAIFFSEEQPFQQFWYRSISGTFL